MNLLLTQKNSLYSHLSVFVQLFLYFAWLLTLRNTDSYYSIYILCALFSAFCLFDNCKNKRRTARTKGVLLSAFSLIFSSITIAANYSIFLPLTSSNILDIPISVLGGFFVCRHILLFVCDVFPLNINCTRAAQARNHPIRVFFASFGIIAAIDLVYLCFYTFPGVVSVDSLHQLNQIFTGTYTNHHPFWHTINVKIIIDLGLSLFGNINYAIALYSVCTIVFMAGSFSYAMTTMYQSGLPKKFLFASFLVYAVMPYNVAYSVNMWKDVSFAGASLLLITSIYRIFKCTGKHKWIDYFILICSCFAFCLWRSNGRYAILASIVVFAIVLKNKHIKLTLIMSVVLIASWILQGPILDAMNIKQTQYVERLSIPVQQVARVITAGCPLTDEEEALLSNIMDIEKIPTLYKEYISDPVKTEIMTVGDDYLQEHKMDYLKLWIKLGIKYPQHYAAAFVEQTKGYWNGGYDYLVYSTIVHENDFGITEAPDSKIASLAANLYFYVFDKTAFAEPLHSIGLHVWLLAAAFIINLLKKRREELLLTVPVIFIVLTLIVATPVFCEFRYSYGVFTTLPLILGATFFSGYNRITAFKQPVDVKEETSL